MNFWLIKNRLRFLNGISCSGIFNCEVVLTGKQKKREGRAMDKIFS